MKSLRNLLLPTLCLVAQMTQADGPPAVPAVDTDDDPVAAAMGEAFTARLYRGFTAAPAAVAPTWVYGGPRLRQSSRAGFKYGLGRHKSLNFSVMPKPTQPADTLADEGLGINPATGQDQDPGWNFTFSHEF